MKTGFDNEKYLTMQSEHIRERISKFDNKLYLEFGGKLFDDYHASRVLPGFEPDSKLRMLMQLSDQAEIVIVISAADIDKNKVRGDLGITYDEDVLRLIEVFTERGLYVGSVCITRYAGQESADLFKNRLEKLGIRVVSGEVDFLLLYTTQPIYDSLLAKGILIRNCENFRGLGEGYYRIAVKKHEENEVLLQELAQITAE